MKQNSGFTLIELLVVISIISILAAVIFPVFAKVRDKARQITCESNMRQLGMGFLQYIEDNDEVMPSAAAGGDEGVGATGGWIFYSAYTADGSASKFDVSRGSVYPYVNNKSVYTCPSDGDGLRSGDTYAYNSCLTSPAAQIISGPAALWPGKPIAVFSAPSNTLLLAEEGANFLLWSSTTNDGLFNMDAAPGYDYQAYSQRHAGSADTLFLDGHVKWSSHDALISANLPTGGNGNSCLQ